MTRLPAADSTRCTALHIEAARAYAAANDCVELGEKVIAAALRGERYSVRHQGRVTVMAAMLNGIVRNGIVTEQGAS